MSDRAGFVYVIQDEHGLCKIGRARNVKTRLQTLSTASSSSLTLIAAWACENAAARESALHDEWRDYRVRGEWFRIPEEVVESWRTGADSVPEITLTPDEQRMMTQATHTPVGDGNWWYSTGTQLIDCSQCGRETQDSPAVMKYIEQYDMRGIQGRAFPQWPQLGWVVWRQCEHCSWMDFKSEYQTVETIRRWRVGPWFRN